MSLFMVERHVKGSAPQSLAAAQAALIAKAAELTNAGSAVRLVRSMIAPRGGRCLSVFECADPAIVWRLHEDAGLPADGAMEVFDLDCPAAAAEIS